MKQLIECVPNFSEGNDMGIIGKITDIIKTVEGVKLLDVDPGKTTNRTVVTFVGEPEPVCEAAFKAIELATELIDMAKHHGEHPRFGATDVCPLVPIANISMEETVEYARKLAKRVGEKLEIPVYCYEFAAYEDKRKNLANCRAGEYEGLKEKLRNSEWKPDFGPATFTSKVLKTGAIAIGARNFLVAYNVNLNTTSVRRANAIAFDVRERGRVKREGNTLTGSIVKDDLGNKVYIPGSLKSVKAIGWYIEEYGIAQISMNLTDITVTSVHKAFEEVCKKADSRGIRVTGSELVGLVPLNAILDAGRYFLKKQQRSLGIADNEIIKIAVKSLGLDELCPFDPKKKIIEYILEDNSTNNLVGKTLENFTEETASESAAPGGGSIAACMGAFGAALGTMVANLSAHKKGWDDRWEEFSGYAEKGKYYHNQLLKLVDEDTAAFNKIMDAFSMSKSNDKEKQKRAEAIQVATKYAIEIPFRVMSLCCESMELIKTMAEIGNPNSVSDAGVGALAARAGVRGAFLNVKINAASYNDKDFVKNITEEASKIDFDAEVKEKEILSIVNDRINGQ